MIALRTFALGAALALAVPVLAQDDVLTPRRVAGLRNVSAAVLSPDAAHVAYTLSVPRTDEQEDGPAWSELHVLDVADGAEGADGADRRTRAFVTGEVDVRSVDWLPDGSGVTFLAKRAGDEHTALYVIPIDGGEARRAVALKSAIRAYSLAPDGARVALVASAAEPEDVEKRKKKGFNQEVYEEDWRPSRVWIASLKEDGGEPRELALEGSAHDVRWSPVDDRLAVVLAPTPLVDDEYMRKSTRIVDAASGEVLADLSQPGKLGRIAWSPDGTHLALVTAADLHDPSPGRLKVAPAAGGEAVELLPNYEGQIEDVAWQDDGALLYLASRGVWTVFERVSLAARGLEKPASILGAGGPILTSLSVSRDGLRAAFVGSTPKHPAELFTMSHGDTGPRRRTDSNPWLSSLRLAPQEEVRFTARDGLELQGVLIRPLDAQEGQSHPLILCVHGGPEAHESNGWLTSYSRPGQVAAARGFAVFHPNYRGSTGRGVEFSKLSQGDPAGAEFDDLVDSVKHLIATGLVDRSRVGVTGGSYGGYATAWCATKLSEHFAAGVMFVGISDEISKFGSTDIPGELYLVHSRKHVWEDWSFFLERSPIYHAENGRTPLLILHGKDDPRVDNGQSRELYRHLKLRGQAPVRLVLYPGEGHGNRKRAARLDYNLRMLHWFEHYLQGAGGAPPAHELDYGAPEAEADAAAEPLGQPAAGQ